MKTIRMGLAACACACAFACALAGCGGGSAASSASTAIASGASSAQEQGVSSLGLENGTYSAEFNTDSSMFHVNEANGGKGVLTVADDGATIHVSLVSKRIVNLYPGTAAQAQEDGAVLLQPTTDTVTYADGTTEEVYGFDIPVPVIDEEFDLAILGEKGTWYDHKVVVAKPVKDDAAANGGQAAAGKDAASQKEQDVSTSTAGNAHEAADKAAADKVAAMIDAIYVQERTDKTDAQCAEAKAAWDALAPAQQELVEGTHADPGYFGDDTGDASKDDPLNADGIGEKEILVTSFGTSFNDSRVASIGAVEKRIQKAFPDWAVRRAFTSQIIVNHIQARDGEFIDNVDQALDRAVANGVKTLVVAPTHLMHGAEYDELVGKLDAYCDKMDIVVAEPLLGEVGTDAKAVNDDKKTVAEALAAAAAKDAGYQDMKAAADAGTAFVFLGHGTSHTAKVTYSQMQAQMDELGFGNAFVGTVEGEPEDTACEAVIQKVKDAGFKRVVLRPMMVVAGDHAHNDMADLEDGESWASQFTASGAFDAIDCQIAGLGEIPAVQDVYVAHVSAVAPK